MIKSIGQTMFFLLCALALTNCAAPITEISWKDLDKSKAYIAHHHEFKNAMDYNLVLIGESHLNNQVVTPNNVKLDGVLYSALPPGKQVLTGRIMLSPRGLLMTAPEGRLILPAELKAGRFYTMITNQSKGAIEYSLKDKKTGEKASATYVFSY